MSGRITYRGTKPFCLPTSLDELQGPTTGTIHLPIHLCWTPGDRIFNLAEYGDALIVYQCVIAEGTVQDQREFLNHSLLTKLWPYLHLDVMIIAAWEHAFESLRGKNEWGRIRTANNASSSPTPLMRSETLTSP